MRNQNIRIHMDIPITSHDGAGFIDGNGVCYDIGAIIKACDNANNMPLPLISCDEDGVRAVVGSIADVKWNPNSQCIEIDGVIFHGGSCEKSVDFDNNKRIITMEFTSFGLCNEENYES